jgi:flagellar protein FlaJ
MKFFGGLIEPYLGYFSDLKEDLQKARMKTSLQEYLSEALMTCFLVFLVELPLLALIFSLLNLGFLFSFITAVTTSIFFPTIFFMLFVNYPKFLIRERNKEIESVLPFSTLYISMIAGSKLPTHEIFKIFSKFKEYGEVTKEMKNIADDTEMFGFDVNTAIERAAIRTPSKKFKEVLWGMLTTIRTGGDLSTFLREKSKNLLDEYRRKLYEFSHSLSVYMEIYLTALILGVVFFVILTSVMSGIAGGGMNLILLQFFAIFFVIPIISTMFILLVKTASPGGE